MTDIDNWLVRYEQGHEKLHKPVIYWTAVPMLVVGFTGLLWALPVPAEFVTISPLLNWGSAFLMVTAIYYFIISLPLAIGLLPFLLGLAAIQMWLTNGGFPAIEIAVGLLLAGIVGVALGRNGAMRAVAEDLQLMMLGPAWLLSVMYKRFGIPF